MTRQPSPWLTTGDTGRDGPRTMRTRCTGKESTQSKSLSRPSGINSGRSRLVHSAVTASWRSVAAYGACCGSTICM
ncbi:hypothetical protein D9M69_706410 [compost metagenome]